MDLLCTEEMMEDTPEGAYGGPTNYAEIAAKRQLSADMNFSGGLDSMPNAFEDSVLVKDPRILPEMLRMEERIQSQIQPNYFKTIQQEVTPETRSSLTVWMYEVAEECNLMDCVFLRAVSYVDRVLSVNRILTNQLQLLGVTCLILACKWSGAPFNVEQLVYYTCDTIPKEMLVDWEIMVVYAIKWDLATIVPSDFVQQFLLHLPKHLWSEHSVEKTRVYLAFLATDPSFIIHTPSIIAAGALATAIGLRHTPEQLDEVVSILHTLTNIETDVLRSVMEHIKSKVANCVTLTEINRGPGSNNPGSKIAEFRHEEVLGITKLEELGRQQATTPTDSQIQNPVQIETPSSTSSGSIDLTAYETLGDSPFY